MGITLFPIALLLMSVLGYIGGIVYPTIDTDEELEQKRKICEKYLDTDKMDLACEYYAYSLANRSMYEEFFDIEADILKMALENVATKKRFSCQSQENRNFLAELNPQYKQDLKLGCKDYEIDPREAYLSHLNFLLTNPFSRFAPMSYLEDIERHLRDYVANESDNGLWSEYRANKWSKLVPELSWTNSSVGMNYKSRYPSYEKCLNFCQRLPTLKYELEHDLKRRVFGGTYRYQLMLDVMKRPIYPFHCEYRCKNRKMAYDFEIKYQKIACDMEISYEESSEGANYRNLLCGSLVGKMAEHGERNTEEYLKYKEIDDRLNKLGSIHSRKSMKEWKSLRDALKKRGKGESA